MIVRRETSPKAVVQAAPESSRAPWLTRGALIGTVVLLAAVTRLAAAQTVRLGVLMDAPRAQLERAWTEDARQVERAYCITGWWAIVRHGAATPTPQDDSIFRVTRLDRAVVTAATPESAEFECAPGVPELHVHPPTTCPGNHPDACLVGGLNAYSCQPSREDLVKLTRRGDPFAVIQCDRRSVRFYYPSEYGNRDGAVLANAANSGPRQPSGNLTAGMTAALATLPDARATLGGSNPAAP